MMMLSSTRSIVASKLLLQLLVGWKMESSVAFVPTTRLVSTRAGEIPATTSKQLATDSAGDAPEFGGAPDNEKESSSNDDSPSYEMGTVKVNDGGSDLTDRFKYKVHALMGDFDPVEGTANDETQDGNIMSALVKFPMQHTFDVVGKVSASTGDDGTNDYAATVKQIIFETTGDESIECDVIPRGKKFIKVRCRAMVESTTMINSIYDELGEMESTVMKF
ncbi:unnamed protein product [Pseudo-nitzschia multistriata]|uniref:Uncharacterized protein n=1 Tax=Pseudo-nitzschia multistriata TaxID=183589 RepID=A0A448Z0H1_9STRA|nr:unnamed protein product [Pseudo-nitzschia multistriata]